MSNFAVRQMYIGELINITVLMRYKKRYALKPPVISSKKPAPNFSTDNNPGSSLLYFLNQAVRVDGRVMVVSHWVKVCASHLHTPGVCSPGCKFTITMPIILGLRELEDVYFTHN